MKNFTYFRPSSPDQVIALLDTKWGATELLAGGTDLHDLQKEYVAQPERVVSVADLGGPFKSIVATRKEPPNIVIGAGCRLADIAADATLRKYCPALTVAAGDVGGPQIRNMGTLGGNLCQRNRCWYFRDEHVPCLLKGGRKCFATDGENRYHAIFTQGHPCVIVHPSTLAPALIALGAVADVQGPKGPRSIELSKFFQAPKNESEREHVLAPNELVLAVKIDCQPGVKNASYEVRQKQSYDWPLAQAAVAFKYEANKATDVKIVLGHVAPTPLVAAEAAKLIEGKEINEQSASEAGKAAAHGAKPLSQNAYKLQLVAVAVKRALVTAAGLKKYWEA